MTQRRPYSRHGLNAAKARVKLRGLAAIDMRTVAARQMVTFRDDLVAALGGENDLSPQRRKLVEMTARVALFLDHLDGWLAEQKSLVNHRTRSVLPALFSSAPSLPRIAACRSSPSRQNLRGSFAELGAP